MIANYLNRDKNESHALRRNNTIHTDEFLIRNVILRFVIA